MARGTPYPECALPSWDRVGESHSVVLTVLEEASTWRCAQAAHSAFGRADWPIVRIGIVYARIVYACEVAQRGGGAGDGLRDRPGMNGEDLCRGVEHGWPPVAPRFVFVTGEKSGGFHAAAVATG